MKWRRYLYTGIITVLIFQSALIFFFRPHQRDLFSISYWKHLFEFGQIMRVVHRDFVDEGKVDYADLRESALKYMIQDLDDYSTYMLAQEYKDFAMDSDQLYVGIGVEIERVESRVTIKAVFDGSPAQEVGLWVGDQFVAVEGDNTEDFTISEMVERLQGESGTSVTVTVYRPVSNERIDFTVARRQVEFPSVRDVAIIDEDNGIGYIRLTQFVRHSAEEFSQALDHLESQGMNALIFDLRNNPGGILPIAVNIAGEFIEAGQVIVTTKGRDKSYVLEEVSKTPVRKARYPIAVLINENSASASEIVSGALQDYKKAVIVGETSVGKGSVQSIYSLGNGDGLRLTTAMYYLPSGRTIDKMGVKPDIEVAMDDEEAFELFSPQNSPKPMDDKGSDSLAQLQPIEDLQVLAAREALMDALKTDF